MIVLAYGVPGAGKSTLLHDLVRAQAAQHRFFINAHSLEWHPEAGHWRGRPPPGLRLLQGEEALEEFVTGADGLVGVEEPTTTGAYVCMNCDSAAVVGAVVRLGWSTYVDDEIDLIARRKGWEDSPLRAIVHQGRHLQNEEGDFTECHVLGACRRPQNLHTDLTDLSDETYVFRLRGGNTRKRLMEDGLLDDESEWERVTSLPDFHFKHVGMKEPARPDDAWLTIPPLGKPPPR